MNSQTQGEKRTGLKASHGAMAHKGIILLYFKISGPTEREQLTPHSPCDPVRLEDKCGS